MSALAVEVFDLLVESQTGVGRPRIARDPLDALRVFVPIANATTDVDEANLFQIMKYLLQIYNVHFVCVLVFLLAILVAGKKGGQNRDLVVNVGSAIESLPVVGAAVTGAVHSAIVETC